MLPYLVRVGTHQNLSLCDQLSDRLDLLAVKGKIMTENSAPKLESEDSMLAFAHVQRIEVLKQLMPAAKLPEDPKDRKLVLQALKDISGDALGRKRIKVDEETNNATRDSQTFIADMLRRMGTGKQFEMPGVSDKAPPVLGAEVPRPELVHGETSTAPSTESIATFSKSTSADKPGDVG